MVLILLGGHGFLAPEEQQTQPGSLGRKKPGKKRARGLGHFPRELDSAGLKAAPDLCDFRSSTGRFIDSQA